MSTLCTVVNFHTDDYDVYIGRAGHGWSGYFGNPYRRKPGEPRGATIAKFRAYFLHRVAADQEFRSRVLALAGKKLGCPGWCKPENCHGTVIADYVNEAMNPAPASSIHNRF